MSRLICLVLILLLSACAKAKYDSTILAREEDRVIELRDYGEGFSIVERKGETEKYLIKGGVCKDVFVHISDKHEISIVYDGLEVTYMSINNLGQRQSYLINLCQRDSEDCKLKTPAIKLVGCP